ncbi:Hypothetical protein, putative [Bodo saltans]|uniref:Uncharacterized protein n=1 Tax=Bodo saltans TaxID=75058 RepID=A0A0S4JMT6_BODSA|nr:Hypothetical protein, putative [Bodo saltans]|eukprot:CUG91540.1 Hypothetical protein, putative [Bodo saltans]
MGTQCSCLHYNREDVEEGSFTSGLELDEDQLHICAAANGNAQNGTTILGTRAPRSVPRNAPLTAASLQNTLLPPVVQIQLPSRTPRNHDDSVDDDEDGVVLPAVNPFATGGGCRRLSLSTAPSSTLSPRIHSHSSSTTVPVSAARDGFLSVGQATPSSCTSLASGILHLQHSDNKSWLSRSGCPLPPPAAQSRKHNGGKGLSLLDPASSGGSSVSSAAYGGARSATAGATTTTVGLGDMQESLRGQNSAGYNGNDPWTPLTATTHGEGDEALSVAVSHIREQQQQLDSGSRCLSSRHTHRRGRHRTLVGSTPTGATPTTTHRGGSAFPGTFATINDLRRTASSVQAPLVMRCNSSNLSHYNKQLQQPPDEVQWHQRNASYQSIETVGFDEEAVSGEMLPPSRHSLREDNDEPQAGRWAPVRLTLATFAVHDE